MTEKEIENAILGFLDFIGVFAWKNQSIGVYDPIKKIYRKSHNPYHRKGVADILGLLEGRLLAIEVKTPTGKLSPEQRTFLAEVNDKGGIAFVSRSVASAALELSKFIDEATIKAGLRKFSWPESFKEQ